MNEPYFVQVQENGCSHCGSGRLWTIICPDGAEFGQSWGADEDGDCPTDAHETCVALNNAFYAGRGDREGRIKELVGSFIAWPLPKTFGPDCGISFDGRKDDEWNKNKPWPTGTNLFTADEARQMLEHLLSDVHVAGLDSGGGS